MYTGGVYPGGCSRYFCAEVSTLLLGKRGDLCAECYSLLLRRKKRPLRRVLLPPPEEERDLCAECYSLLPEKRRETSAQSATLLP